MTRTSPSHPTPGPDPAPEPGAATAELRGGSSGRSVGGLAGAVLVVAGAFLVVELSMAARYGFHRDELYFLACSRHLAWGYVDQPPLVPAVARLATSIAGPSVVALRVLPALAGAATVLLSGLVARELGGGRRAQVVAATAAATSAQMVAAFHLLSTAAFDIFFWALITWLVSRLLCRSEPRLWLAVGAVTGTALLNKLNVVFLILALGTGLVLTGRARCLLNRWAAGGAALAAAIATPDIVWNATHDWAQISMLHALHSENSTLGASVGFIPAQLVVVGPVLAVVWIPGLRRLAQGAGRALAATFIVLVVVFSLSGAKPYYLAGMYCALFAAGGLFWEERLADRGPVVAKRSLQRLLGASAAGAVLLAPLTLPVLPEAALAHGPWQGNINKDISATVGWNDLVRQLAAIASALPPQQRSRLVILTGDYGAAGAVDMYGPRYGLPPAISGHNNYWWWGPGRSSDDSTTIAVNLPAPVLRRYFSEVRPGGRVLTPHGVWTEERGDPIWICNGQTAPWAQAWAGLRHYG